MAIGKKEVSYCVELDEALSLLVELVKDVKAGKGALAIAMENLPLIIKGLNGLDQAGLEAKDHQALAITCGSRVAEIVDIFAKPVTVPA